MIFCHTITMQWGAYRDRTYNEADELIDNELGYKKLLMVVPSW